MYKIIYSFVHLRKINKMIDPYTGEEFEPKRRSQKFATPQNRIAYNNAKAAAIREEKSKYDKPLHLNYRILEEVTKGKREVRLHQERLIGKGFHFGVHNHVEMHGETYRYCIYQYVLVHEGEYTKIIRND